MSPGQHNNANGLKSDEAQHIRAWPVKPNFCRLARSPRTRSASIAVAHGDMQGRPRQQEKMHCSWQAQMSGHGSRRRWRRSLRGSIPTSYMLDGICKSARRRAAARKDITSTPVMCYLYRRLHSRCRPSGRRRTPYTAGGAYAVSARAPPGVMGARGVRGAERYYVVSAVCARPICMYRYKGDDT